MSAWLAGAYFVLALGLAWSLTESRNWARRIPFIVGAPLVAIGLWLGRPDPAGWPSGARPPAHAALVSAVVREPDPATADRGGIYLWLDVGARAPRAYGFPYSRSLHDRVQAALRQLAKQHPVEVASRRRARGSGGSGGASGVRFQLHLAHPPGLPPKPR
jgi:hypothetical protein